MATFSISKLIDQVLDGVIRIPAFQRGFVWKSESVAFLMDSLYRNYPVGSLLLWQTHEQLAKERNLGEFELPAPKKEWPIQYVLDGQQRLTSIFSVFQTELKPTNKSDWLDIYADLDAEEGDRENLFLALPTSEADSERHFPLKLIFDGAAAHAAIIALQPERQKRAIKIVDRFKEVQISYETIDIENKEDIAIVFERVNRAGVRLDAFQLLSAWTWSTEFDLKESLDELQEEIKPYGFGTLAEDANLFMKCCAAVVEDDAQISTVINLKGPKVRSSYGAITNGITGAIDFLRRELGIVNMDVMPYPSMIVPLTRFFSKPGSTAHHPSATQLTELKRWFWRSCFSRRYSSGVGRAHAADIAAMAKLRTFHTFTLHPEASFLDEAFFLENVFSVSSVNTKIFICMLIQRQPVSLLSGAALDMENVLQQLNRKEFHHIFPRKYLEDQGWSSEDISVLSNFCFISSGDNKIISKSPPKEYIKKINESRLLDICERNLLWRDFAEMDYLDFIDKRASILSSLSKELSA